MYQHYLQLLACSISSSRDTITGSPLFVPPRYIVGSKSSPFLVPSIVKYLQHVASPSKCLKKFLPFTFYFQLSSVYNSPEATALLITVQHFISRPRQRPDRVEKEYLKLNKAAQKWL